MSAPNPAELIVREEGGAVCFEVRVTPRASRSSVTGTLQGRLRVAVTAPPVEGAANAEVIEVVAEALGVPRRAVSILRGDRGRVKAVRVEGIDAATLRAKLSPA